MVMAKALAQYFEATNDPRVITVLTKYFHYQLQTLGTRPLSSWGKYRWQDEAFAVEWLFERTRDPKLLSLIALLQTQGYDWEAEFANFPFTQPTPHRFPVNEFPDEAMQRHGVNNAQALKASAVRFRYSGDKGEHAAFARQLNALDTYHGLPNGMFSCDEHLGGREPQHGSELCSVVETDVLAGSRACHLWGWLDRRQDREARVQCASWNFYRRHVGASIRSTVESGRVELADAPVDDEWTRVQPVWIGTAVWMLHGELSPGLAEVHHFTVDGPKTTMASSLLYMLRPKFGRSIGRDQRSHRRGIRLSLSRLMSDSPLIQIHPPTSIWASGSLFGLRSTRIILNGRSEDIATDPGSFATLNGRDRGDVVEIKFDMQPGLAVGSIDPSRSNGGRLYFSHSPGEDWVKLRDRPPTADWQVFPKDPWNYALRVDEQTVSSIEVKESPLTEIPFGSQDPPVTLTVPARKMDEWRAIDGVAPAPPLSPVHVDAPNEHPDADSVCCCKAPHHCLSLAGVLIAKMRWTCTALGLSLRRHSA